MGICRKIVVRMAGVAVLLCALPSVVPLVAAQQASDGGQPAQPSSSATEQRIVSPTQLPDSPGATLAESQSPIAAQNDSQQQSAAPTSSQPQGEQSQVPQQAPQKPVGTAAAEPTHAAGVAASQPTGVAIAPAKQRRTRTIIIRVGAIIGVGVAVGTVVGLTAATSSKPPGAH
jgi:cytoskeletal protein RodZ